MNFFLKFYAYGCFDFKCVCVHYACTVSQEGNRASDHLQLELYTVRVAMSVGAGS